MPARTLADRSRKNTVEGRMAELPDIHPAEELCAVREEMKILESRADELRAQILRMADDVSRTQ